LLRPGGRTGFFTVFVPPGLSKRDHRRAVRLGPRAVFSDREQAVLLRAAGFVQIEEVDFTAEFLETARRWLRFSQEFERALRESLGNQVFDQQSADRKGMVAAIEEQLLARALFVAAAAPAKRTSPGLSPRRRGVGNLSGDRSRSRSAHSAPRDRRGTAPS
jgi:hypothetical protein